MCTQWTSASPDFVKIIIKYMKIFYFAPPNLIYLSPLSSHHIVSNDLRSYIHIFLLISIIYTHHIHLLHSQSPLPTISFFQLFIFILFY